MYDTLERIYTLLGSEMGGLDSALENAIAAAGYGSVDGFNLDEEK